MASAKDAEAFAKDAEAFASEGNGHIADEENPHNVTASQVGAYDKKEIDEKLDNLEEKVGSIDTALDAILAIQSEVVGDEA